MISEGLHRFSLNLSNIYSYRSVVKVFMACMVKTVDKASLVCYILCKKMRLMLSPRTEEHSKDEHRSESPHREMDRLHRHRPCPRRRRSGDRFEKREGEVGFQGIRDQGSGGSF